jgi:hypothetical protein
LFQPLLYYLQQDRRIRNSDRKYPVNYIVITGKMLKNFGIYLIATG